MAGAMMAAATLSGASISEAAADDSGAAMAACRSIADTAQRLGCYDAIAAKLSAPKFSGRLTATTERFTITSPHVLRYESDGPIFVMYLKNAAGEVVQNLHIGGGGQDRFVIETPGTYFLTVSGSETWRIWLDPQ
jgi:hypothetical protein